MLEIIFSESHDAEFSKIIANEFEHFAEKNNLINNYLPFTFIAKGNEKLMGIIKGYSYYDEAHISELVVLEDYRKQNIGRKLVDAVEKYCRERKINNLNCSTYDFQAPDFYKKCGFALEFTRVNMENQKLSKHFFVKYFR